MSVTHPSSSSPTEGTFVPNRGTTEITDASSAIAALEGALGGTAEDLRLVLNRIPDSVDECSCDYLNELMQQAILRLNGIVTKPR